MKARLFLHNKAARRKAACREIIADKLARGAIYVICAVSFFYLLMVAMAAPIGG